MFFETPRTWIVLADGGRAKIMEYHGPDGDLEMVPEGDMAHANLRSRDLVSDDRGRAVSSGGTGAGRSAMEYTTNPQAYAEWKFIHDVAEFLDQHSDDFDRLIVAAAPRALGDLRKQISDNVQSKVYAELDKDLTKVPIQEIRRHLQGVINISVH